MDRQEAEELVGPIEDWQWRIIRDFLPGGPKPSFTVAVSPRQFSGKRQAMQLLMDTYERLGWRVEKTDFGWAVWRGE